MGSRHTSNAQNPKQLSPFTKLFCFPVRLQVLCYVGYTLCRLAHVCYHVVLHHHGGMSMSLISVTMIIPKSFRFPLDSFMVRHYAYMLPVSYTYTLKLPKVLISVEKQFCKWHSKLF